MGMVGTLFALALLLCGFAATEVSASDCNITTVILDERFEGGSGARRTTLRTVVTPANCSATLRPADVGALLRGRHLRLVPALEPPFLQACTAEAPCAAGGGTVAAKTAEGADVQLSGKCGGDGAQLFFFARHRCVWG